MKWIGIISAVAVAFSLFVEHILHQPPCFLCLAQRTLYLMLIPSALFSRPLTISLLVLNGAVGTYHSLVQFHLIEERCTVKYGVENIDSYHALLEKPGGCSENSWKIAGIPASVGSASLSIALLALTRKKITR